MSGAAIGRFTHDGLFYSSDEELPTAAVPFLRAGLDADETVMLVCTQRNAALLTQALDADPSITFPAPVHRPPGAARPARGVCRIGPAVSHGGRLRPRGPKATTRRTRGGDCGWSATCATTLPSR